MEVSIRPTFRIFILFWYHALAIPWYCTSLVSLVELLDLFYVNTPFPLVRPFTVGAYLIQHAEVKYLPRMHEAIKPHASLTPKA